MGKRKSSWVTIQEAAAIVEAAELAPCVPWLDQIDSLRSMLAPFVTMASAPSPRCVRARWKAIEYLDVHGRRAVRTELSQVYRTDLIRFLERHKFEESVRMLAEGRR